MTFPEVGDSDVTILSQKTLDEWIGDRLPGRPAPLEARRMGEGTGIANALYLIRRGGENSMTEMAPRLLRGAAEFARGQRV
jgi:hypothetical protein